MKPWFYRSVVAVGLLLFVLIVFGPRPWRKNPSCELFQEYASRLFGVLLVEERSWTTPTRADFGLDPAALARQYGIDATQLSYTIFTLSGEPNKIWVFCLRYESTPPLLECIPLGADKVRDFGLCVD